MEKITANHPDSQSADLVTQHIEQLSKLFPEAIKEGKVDFEALQDLLGNYIDTPEERFQLNWAGKSQARREAQKRSTGTLRPCPEESVFWDTTENLYIEGDNLEVLKMLQKSYYKKVKMIYIDPPYNTGNDFVYKDNYSDNLTNYLEISGQDRTLGTNTESDGRYHSNWLNMMYPRLKLARNLLTDDGVIFISIDDNEVACLRKVCDEIFGEENFVAQITRATGTPTGGGGAKPIVNEIDYLFVYSKSTNLKFTGTEFTKEESAIYDKEDENGVYLIRSLRRTGGEDRREDRPTMYFPLISPNGTEVYPIAPAGYESRWICGKDKFDELNNANLIEWKQNGNNEWTVYQKFYLEGRLKQSGNLWTKIEGNKKATRDIRDLFDGKKIFDFPKPVGFISKILQISTDGNGLVLDFFSGSGSTAHAVMQLNAEDGGNRKFIMVQLPEATPEESEARKAGYKTIAEIGKERIRRAGKKIIEELKTKQAKEGGLFPEEKKKLDIGFKVFKLDSSNINTWDTSTSNLEGALYNSVQNIKSDRTEYDLLYEILLKYGIDLVQPINEHFLAGKKVYEMGAGALIVCMADQVKQEVAEAIAQLWKEVKPAAIDESSKAAINCRVVFKDNGFDDNNDKTNVLQILKQHGIDNVVTI